MMSTRAFFAVVFTISSFFAIALAMPSSSQHLHTRALKAHRDWKGHQAHQLLAGATARSSSVPEPIPAQDLTPEQAIYLNGHNLLRMQFGAVNLSWSNDLASAARQWANGCELEHSAGSLGPYGETLAAGTGDFTILGALDVWAEEASQYDPANPTASHFTQMVWQSTTEVGCAVSTCDNMFPNLGAARYFVCEYFPAGNVVGQFQDNVQA